MNRRRLLYAMWWCCGFAVVAVSNGCGDDPPPAAPTPPAPFPPPAAPVLTAPAPDAPAENEEVQTSRPTLRVLNATADQSGTRTYEFQLSSNRDFPAGSIVSSRAGVAEGTDGKTSSEVQSQLQEGTTFYWRARARQGTTDGPWSSTASFRTPTRGMGL